MAASLVSRPVPTELGFKVSSTQLGSEASLTWPGSEASPTQPGSEGFPNPSGKVARISKSAPEDRPYRYGEQQCKYSPSCCADLEIRGGSSQSDLEIRLNLGRRRM